MNITFNKAEPNENFPIMRFEAEDGSCEVGLTPMLFGVRVRAGDAGAGGVEIDYCAGKDSMFQLQLLAVVKSLIETFPVGTPMREIAKQLPTYKRRPINEDPCWPALQRMLEVRTQDGEDARTITHQEANSLSGLSLAVVGDLDPPFDPDDPDGEWAHESKFSDPSEDDDWHYSDTNP